MPRLLSTLAFAAVILPGYPSAAPVGWKPLLAPLELEEILAAEADIRIVQVSGDASGGLIPGSVTAPYAEWRGPAENPGALPDITTLQALVQRLGIARDTPVVVVHAGADPTDMGTATRVYWTLKSLGVADLAVLNGGLAGWTEAGLPSVDAPAAVPPSAFAPALSGEWRITTAEIAALAESGEAGRLVDARPSGFFEGALWTIARPGTIRGAESFTFERWFEGDAMVDSTRARAIAVENGLTDAPLTVSFCNTGHWASINWFALSELADVDNVRLYAESMAEWTEAGGALDNAPGRLTYYYRVTRNWFDEIF